jgi:tripartite-type tricarboxylate transporter receptor subunit TctC
VLSTLGGAIDKAGASPEFNAAMANIGLEPSYQGAAEFAKFWDEDARRAEDTIHRIGKVG